MEEGVELGAQSPTCLVRKLFGYWRSESEKSVAMGTRELFISLAPNLFCFLVFPPRVNLFKKKEILNMQKSCDENEGTPQNTPKADEGHPSEDSPQQAEENLQASGESVGEDADGSLRAEPAQASPEPKEDTPTRHLNPEEVIRGVDELERLREEIRRVRNKFVMMHWKQRHSRSRPYPVCFRP